MKSEAIKNHPGLLSDVRGSHSGQLTCSLGEEADLGCPEEVQEQPTGHPRPRLSVWISTGYGR